MLQQQRNLFAIIEYLQKIGVQPGFIVHSSDDSLLSAVSNGDSKEVLLEGGVLEGRCWVTSNIKSSADDGSTCLFTAQLSSLSDPSQEECQPASTTASSSGPAKALMKSEIQNLSFSQSTMRKSCQKECQVVGTTGSSLVKIFQIRGEPNCPVKRNVINNSFLIIVQYEMYL